MNKSLYESLINKIAKIVKAEIESANITEIFESTKNKNISPKWIEYNKENIEQYKNKNPELAEVKTGKNYDGYLIVKGGKLVGYCYYKNNKIIDIYVADEFTNHRWATKMLIKAKNDGCTEALAKKNNRH